MFHNSPKFLCDAGNLYLEKDIKPEFEISMSCLFLCVAYLNRCCVANLLMSARAFSFIDSIDAGLGCGVI